MHPKCPGPLSHALLIGNNPPHDLLLSDPLLHVIPDLFVNLFCVTTILRYGNGSMEQTKALLGPCLLYRDALDFQPRLWIGGVNHDA